MASTPDTHEEFDDFETFEAHETARKLPIGWVVLYLGLIVFGIYYVAAYTPIISGWSQDKAYQESIQK
ncbi:cbb3-type cytochrome c oxidase N-terminal domain-containing protein [Chrysiogenes arsenatis]|uniref:cbb3-type cytochrome c oxidase N-terminal domain-containing protein n=1 Tax=Chrysiogenes arsenatis TaxID=309797 RepID=UPI000401A318|nr:cbb3-type cytochrome c oxidase N-terminal domain-containing protein [Chrysiogenes arsenatis]